MCCDGTWNTPDERNAGGLAPTNVAKIAMGVAREDDTNTPQRLYYQPGVGTRRFQHVRGGAFGYGLSHNVRECYRFVVENYKPGDELFFFGFSRGAYTARSTVGLIHNCGILRPEHHDRLDEAYGLYKTRRSGTEAPDGIEAKLFRRCYAYDDTKIHFIGVWDTVGAVGIPIDGIPVPKGIKRHWGFHDTELNKRVSYAYQALAIDERRRPFTPALWTVKQKWEGQSIEQVWFAGGHRDVGGGTPDPSLSEIPLRWMVDRANACGLAFKPGHFVKRSPRKNMTEHETAREALARAEGEWLSWNPRGRIHNRLGWYRVLLPKRRLIGDLPGHDPTMIGHQFVASTALQRLENDSSYHPRNLKDAKKDNVQVMVVMDESEPDEPPARHERVPQTRARRKVLDRLRIDQSDRRP